MARHREEGARLPRCTARQGGSSVLWHAQPLKAPAAAAQHALSCQTTKPMQLFDRYLGNVWALSRELTAFPRIFRGDFLLFTPLIPVVLVIVPQGLPSYNPGTLDFIFAWPASACRK